MAFLVTISGVNVGTTAGPFEIREYSNSGSLLATGVSRVDLIAGYPVSASDGTDEIYVGALGSCTGSSAKTPVDAPVPVPVPVPVAPQPVPQPVPVAPQPVPAPVAPTPQPQPQPVPVAPQPVPAPVAPTPVPQPVPAPAAPVPVPAAPVPVPVAPTPVPKPAPAPAVSCQSWDAENVGCEIGEDYVTYTPCAGGSPQTIYIPCGDSATVPCAQTGTISEGASINLTLNGSC